MEFVFFEPGNLVKFPCDYKGYEYFVGLLIGYRDNPSDVKAWKRSRKFGGPAPLQCPEGPRKIADVLFEGKVSTCWARSLNRVPRQAA